MERPKRFLVFAGEEYYPGGGWSDFYDSFDTEGEALNAGQSLRRMWWHIVDLEDPPKAEDV